MSEFAEANDRGAREGRELVAEIRRTSMPALLVWRVQKMIEAGTLTTEDVALLSEVARAAAEMPPAPPFVAFRAAQRRKESTHEHRPSRRTG